MELSKALVKAAATANLLAGQSDYVVVVLLVASLGDEKDGSMVVWRGCGLAAASGA